jgi:hypothetical protein
VVHDQIYGLAVKVTARSYQIHEGAVSVDQVSDQEPELVSLERCCLVETVQLGKLNHLALCLLDEYVFKGGTASWEMFSTPA